MEDEATIRVRIEGRVQGVWYRAWTVKQAEKHGLSGWVRNREDGSVEALFRGTETTVRNMVEACRRGPFAAKVVGVSQLPPENQEGDDAAIAPGVFRQLPTL